MTKNLLVWVYRNGLCAIVESETMVAASSAVTHEKVIKSGEILASRPAEFFKKMLSKEINSII